MLYLLLSLFFSQCVGGSLQLKSIDSLSLSLSMHSASTQVAPSLHSPFDTIVRWSKARAARAKSAVEVLFIFYL